jgi:predicted acylesterase/phospholipase RssA
LVASPRAAWLTSASFDGYLVRSILWTSIGALIGGIYATGKLDIYADRVLALAPEFFTGRTDPWRS